MYKKMASLTLALALMCSLSVSAFAAAPRWGDAAICNANLDFSGSTAICFATVRGGSDTSKILVTVSLQKSTGNGQYATVRSWSETVYSQDYSLYEEVAGCASGSYRLVVSAVVYTPSSNEAVGQTAYASR